MFMAVVITAVAGAVLALAWVSIAALGRGPSRWTGGAVVVLLGCCILALIAFLAGDDDLEEGSRWGSHGAHEVTQLTVAGAVLAGVLGLLALRGGGSRRALSAIAAAAAIAAFGGLWLIALVHEVNLS